MQVIEISIYCLPLTLLHCCCCFHLSEAGWRRGSVGSSLQPPGPAGEAALQPADQRVQHSHRLHHSQYALSRELTVHLLHISHFHMSTLVTAVETQTTTGGHLFRFSRFGLVSHFSRLIFVFILSLRDGWSLRNLWRSKLKVSGLLLFVLLF